MTALELTEAVARAVTVAAVVALKVTMVVTVAALNALKI